LGARDFILSASERLERYGVNNRSLPTTKETIADEGNISIDLNQKLGLPRIAK
jgi:hypothetical protein